MSGKKVLVAGGAGFLGSHLCERLLADGDRVFCLDNFYSGNRANIARLESHDRFQLIEHDITEPYFIETDQIYNLACPASPVQYQQHPVQTIKTSVLGAINLLEVACKTGAAILQASTSEIYGDPSEHPQRESYWGNVNPVGVRSCYDEGKRCAETLFFDFRRQYGVRIKVARIFNTYGPNMMPDDGRVISNFIVQALSGAPLTIFGDGSQTRSFCYVADLVEGLIRLMATPDEITGPVNLGNPREDAIRAIAEKVLALTGSPSEIVTRALPGDDPRRRRPDIGLAHRLLDWQPEVPLDEGLRRTIGYFKDVLRVASPPK